MWCRCLVGINCSGSLCIRERNEPMTRPTKNRLEEIRRCKDKPGSWRIDPIPQLLSEIDALTAELEASEWVRRDNSLRTYDGLTEERDRLRDKNSALIHGLQCLYGNRFKADAKYLEREINRLLDSDATQAARESKK